MGWTSSTLVRLVPAEAKILQRDANLLAIEAPASDGDDATPIAISFLCETTDEPTRNGGVNSA